MDQRNLNRLEYQKVIALLQECATFNIGRELAEKLMPVIEIAEIGKRQKETTEAKDIIRREPDLPLGGLRDIRNLIRKSVVGGILEPQELTQVGDMLFAMRRMKVFFRERHEAYPLVTELTAGLCSLKQLEDQISSCIDSNGEVADHASPELRGLRSTLRNLEASIKSKMESVIRSAEFQKCLQDPIITMRGDRYVVPVKQEYRAQFPGIVHDQSASGATLFIEPMPVVEKNNELRRTVMEEKQEIVRILIRLTNQLSVFHEEISAGVLTAGEIDLVFAKGRLSHLMNGGEPKINQDRRMNLIGARHPLLKVKAVPINVWLGRDFDIIVITGPNTGGKTVALKTVGLLVLMAQAGLHIPAEDGSEICIFDKVYADIGDEQSIEQSLSTFSSHMINIISILSDVDDKSLVLLDELGAGTDPAEGAALAMSILDYLHEKRVLAIATTHYSELKAFAFNRPKVENASVEFDLATLKPTYKLNIGQPGSSSAFDIALRLGLNKDIINKARQAISHEDIQVTDLIRELEDNRRTSEAERTTTLKLKNDIQLLKADYERKLNDLAVKRSEVLEKARQEAGELRRKARIEAEGLIEEIKGFVSAGANQQTLTAARNVRNKLKRLGRDDEEPSEVVYFGETPHNLQKGQEVFLPKYNQHGVALSGKDNNGQALIQVGVMKLSIPVSEMRLEKIKKVNETGGPKIALAKAKDIATEVDLRGMAADEAVEKVEKYLDDAYLAGLPQACIIHGKGTGVLRQAITNLLAGHKFVKSHRLGIYGEGGNGVTIVEFK